MTCPHGGVAWMALVLPEVLLSRLPKNVDYNCYLTVLRSILCKKGAAPQRVLAIMGRFQAKVSGLSRSRLA